MVSLVADGQQRVVDFDDLIVGDLAQIELELHNAVWVRQKETKYREEKIIEKAEFEFIDDGAKRTSGAKPQERTAREMERIGDSQLVVVGRK